MKTGTRVRKQQKSKKKGKIWTERYVGKMMDKYRKGNLAGSHTEKQGEGGKEDNKERGSVILSKS